MMLKSDSSPMESLHLVFAVEEWSLVMTYQLLPIRCAQSVKIFLMQIHQTRRDKDDWVPMMKLLEAGTIGLGQQVSWSKGTYDRKVQLPPYAHPRSSMKCIGFSDEWKLALNRVLDNVASEAIKSFINVVHSISLKQTEELKIKKRTQSASKELEKRASSLRNIEKKYYNSYSLVGIVLPDTGRTISCGAAGYWPAPFHVVLPDTGRTISWPHHS